jgi:hypothetical protein
MVLSRMQERNQDRRVDAEFKNVSRVRRLTRRKTDWLVILFACSPEAKPSTAQKRTRIYRETPIGNQGLKTHKMENRRIPLTGSLRLI